MVNAILSFFFVANIFSNFFCYNLRQYSAVQYFYVEFSGVFFPLSFGKERPSTCFLGGRLKMGQHAIITKLYSYCSAQ